MYYSESLYGESKYAENIVKQKDIDDYETDLSKYIPLFIYKNNTFNAMYKAQEHEANILYYNQDDLVNQLFIDTATWGLVIWEKIYGITTNLNYSYEERREVVKARRRGQGTCTKKLIENVAEAFSGGECRVIENTAPFTFTIQFVGVKGIPKNMKGLINAIDEIKPAHLVYNFKYTYTTWNYLDSKNVSYSALENTTWSDLEIYN